MPSETPIQLTDPALERMREVVAKDASVAAGGVRIGVTKGGCSGYEYTMKVVAEPLADDQVLERDGVRIFIDPEAVPLLEGTIIDYSVGLTRAGFRFENPKATRTCGCGESFGV